jgi:hypothetical protein
MRREGQGSASISAVVVFLSALLALGLMATILPPVSNVLSGFREGLRERGERGSELIRIYIHTANETELEPPIITIINGYDRESILTDYVVVARDGRVLAAGKMGESLGGIRIPAGARIDLTPADFGLSYGTFAAMADEVKAIYVRTAEGNSFGSSYGPPPKISPDYQLSVTQKPHHVIVEGSTTMIFNFTIFNNFTFPPLGDAMVVKNFIIVDDNGFVRGGASFGRKWSDGSFDPNWLPNEVAALTQPEVVPINGYYVVPPFPNYPNPRYIEIIEFYPVEYYTPGSPVGATAYYARFAGGRGQKPIVLTYPYRVPEYSTTTIYYTFSTIYTSRTGKFTTITFTSYTTISETKVTGIWLEGGLVKYVWDEFITMRPEKLSEFITMRPEKLRTATATIILGDFRSQIKQAVGGTQTLSGDAVAHLAGTVQGGQAIRVKAPIVVLNYISGSVPSPPPSPGGGGRGGGGGGEIGGPTMHCEATGQPLVAPSGTSRPATDISGNTVSDISVEQRGVAFIWSGFCRPR